MRLLDFGQNQGKNFKMKLGDNISTSRPIPFLASSRCKTTQVTEEDKAVAREHDVEIHELCRDTTLALQELTRLVGVGLGTTGLGAMAFLREER
jgi:hypothetical protein